MRFTIRDVLWLTVVVAGAGQVKALLFSGWRVTMLAGSNPQGEFNGH